MKNLQIIIIVFLISLSICAFASMQAKADGNPPVSNTFTATGLSGTDSVTLTGTYLGVSSNIVTLNSDNACSASAWSDSGTRLLSLLFQLTAG